MADHEPRSNQEIVSRILILKNGAKMLRDFGYPTAEANEIMTTPIFKLMFRGWLEEQARDLGDDPQMVEVKALMLTMVEETYA
jgi:hypothetical protein